MEIVAVLGDLVGSRRLSPEARVAAQSHLRRLFEAAQYAKFDLTIGDEFQGLFEDLDAALAATLEVQLGVNDDLDVRFGIGVGELYLEDERNGPFHQDGPAWWSAREAIDEVHVWQTARGRDRTRRTLVRSVGHVQVGTANAYLACRDHLVAKLDARERRLLSGAMQGMTHQQMAEAEGLSRQAVSERMRTAGLLAIRESVQSLGLEA